jgi:hypothetical protein
VYIISSVNAVVTVTVVQNNVYGRFRRLAAGAATLER